MTKIVPNSINACPSSDLCPSLAAAAMAPPGRSVDKDDDDFRAMASHAPYGLIVHRDGMPLFVNQAWAKLHGYEAAEIMAMPSISLLRHSGARTDSPESEPRLSWARPQSYAYRAKHKNGGSIWLDVVAHLINWRGLPATFCTIVGAGNEPGGNNPEEESHPVVQLAEQAEERFLTVINQLPDGYALFDDCEMLVMCNRHYRKMHEGVVQNLAPGITFEQIIRCRAASGMIVDALDREEEWVAERLANFRKDTYTGDLKRANGRWIHVRNRRTIDGGVLLMVIDVTDKKLMEQALAASELRFKDFTKLAADWFWEQDVDGRYTYLSDSVEALTNQPIDSLLGLDPTEVFGGQVFEQPSWRDRWLALRGKGINDTIEAEYDLRAADGTAYRVRSFVMVIKDPDGVVIGYRGAAKDITEEHRLSERLEHQANHDQLTGLLNRRSFEECLSRALDASVESKRQAVFCFIDLDQFKVVNDTVGHLAGDKLLQQVANLVCSKVCKNDDLARLGGDEFGLLLYDCSLRRALHVAKNLIAVLNSDRFLHSGKIFEIGASIGLASITRQTESISDIMAQADLACYAAKENGRNRVHVFQNADVDLRRRREEMSQASSIRLALDQDRFALFAQPITSLADREKHITHYEILLRMVDNNDRLIVPGAFIPAAERYGLMVKIDRWVVNQSCAKLKDCFWQQPDLQVNINLSGLTLDGDMLLGFVEDTLHTFSIAPQQLCFEITETAAIRHLARTQTLMAKLQKLGCKFALDDFGSGLSSFKYLKKLPVDYLKIDGSFIRDIEKDQRNRAMVAAIIQVGRVLGIKTVAECAESDQILLTLRELGVDFAQGYAIGEPQPLPDIFALRTGSIEAECEDVKNGAKLRYGSG